MGCLDIELLPHLAELLGISVEALLLGKEIPAKEKRGSMKNTVFYLCPQCGELIAASGKPDISCCGRRLNPLEAQKVDTMHTLQIEPIENELFVTSGHPMEKSHFIAFVALVTGDQVQIFRQFPQWDLQLRLRRQGTGRLYFYCTDHGLYWQTL